MTEHRAPDGSFNILNSLLKASSLDIVLQEKSLFTLLAPTDAAFTKLPAGEIDSLSQEQYKDRLVSLLSRHVISTLISSTSLATCSIEAKTVEQETVAITVQGKWISMHSATGIQLLDASVVGNDIKSSNRVIIPINAVAINENINASEGW
ncbi:MAG: fasciclin domain-containing protein [Parasphingorhabdus sp.]|uniref:fasciclin domain-containing protein n=1 Tax=Parasphingorhabdus sp. TaxID=2709688 RepID=UPI003296CB23